MSDLQPSLGRTGLRGVHLNPDIMQAAGAKGKPSADRPILSNITNLNPASQSAQPTGKAAAKASQRQPEPHAAQPPKAPAQPEQAESQPELWCDHPDCLNSNRSFKSRFSLNAHRKVHKKPDEPEPEPDAPLICLELAIQATAGVNANARLHQRSVRADAEGKFAPGVITIIKEVLDGNWLQFDLENLKYQVRQVPGAPSTVVVGV